MLQAIKDMVIASGMESWARPIWTSLMGKQLDQNDLLTKQIMEKVLTDRSVCIDIGCHKGLILDIMMQCSPMGEFYAFEPIPYLYNILRRKYRKKQNVHLYNYALYSESGEAEFYIAIGDMGYSGLRDRSLDVKPPIMVPTARLDQIISEGIHIDFMKIDVEGAELSVLEGAQSILARSKPTVLFEHGLGGADHFGSTPEAVFDLFSEWGMSTFLIPDFLCSKSSLSKAQFCDEFYTNRNYYFIATENAKP